MCRFFPDVRFNSRRTEVPYKQVNISEDDLKTPELTQMLDVRVLESRERTQTVADEGLLQTGVIPAQVVGYFRIL